MARKKPKATLQSLEADVSNLEKGLSDLHKAFNSGFGKLSERIEEVRAEVISKQDQLTQALGRGGQPGGGGYG